MKASTEIDKVIEKCPVIIGYVPLRTEVDFSNLISLPPNDFIYHIKSRAALDPNQEAVHALQAANGRNAIILMPGRKFDSSGTRLGQGGGWYDRFLALVPHTWGRIGFCFEDQFIPEPLPRQPWDQPMDYVAVASRTESVITLYETNARPGMLL